MHYPRALPLIDSRAGPRDRFQRTIDYLRISLTDHCNLRCVYCMPLTGLRFAPPEKLLSATELATIARVAARIGFRKIRFTGGEPTLRRDLVEIVGRVRAAAPEIGLSMTTNAILLPKLARPLRDAGLDRVNVHVDTMNPEHLKRIMRFGNLDDILRGLEAAEEAGLSPIKINAVIARGFNEADVVDLARLTLSRDWHVRFIELMPLGGGPCAQLARDQYVSNMETRDRIEDVFGPLRACPSSDSSDEARNYQIADAFGVVGFISPVSEPYCGNCNRMRLTAEGRFHLCLLHDDEIDLRATLRGGGDDEAVEQELRRAVSLKPIGHELSQGVSTLPAMPSLWATAAYPYWQNG